MARKFSDEDLMDLLRQGKNQSECARILGVRDSAVSRRLSRINMAVSKDIGLFSARRIVDRHLSTSDQTEAMQRQIRDLLEMINVVVHGEHLPEYWSCRQKLARLVTGKGNLATLLSSLQSELRKLLEFDFSIKRELYSLKQVKDFQETVLEAIAEADPDTAERVRRKLVEINAVHSVLDFDANRNGDNRAIA